MFVQKTANAFVNLFDSITNIVNANTTFNSLDRVVTAFSTAQNSYGGFASWAIVNIIANLAVIFDATGNGFERWRLRIKSIKSKAQEADQAVTGEGELKDEIGDFFSKLEKQFEVVNKKLLCGHPLEDKPYCLPPITSTNDEEEDSNEEEFESIPVVDDDNHNGIIQQPMILSKYYDEI